MAASGSTFSTTLSQYYCEILARMHGPGGYYNLGNLIGLVSGITMQILHQRAGTAETVADYLIGSASALWLTIATIVFMVSGEAYYRAWKNGFPPNGALNWWGDFLSGIGALALGVALFLLDQPILAATAGLLHAIGKFGSTIYFQRQDLQMDWPKIFRWMVVFSRMPAMGATTMALLYAISVGSIEMLGAPATLIICYLLWLRADLLLLKE